MIDVFVFEFNLHRKLDIREEENHYNHSTDEQKRSACNTDCYK